jgi:predicted dinucleotide-binding enzyme
MVTPVEISIIGSGKVGQALGSWFATADASVEFSSRGPNPRRRGGAESWTGS